MGTRQATWSIRPSPVPKSAGPGAPRYQMMDEKGQRDRGHPPVGLTADGRQVDQALI